MDIYSKSTNLGLLLVFSTTILDDLLEIYDFCLLVCCDNTLISCLDLFYYEFYSKSYS